MQARFPFLKIGQRINPKQKVAAGHAEEDNDGRGHNPFMVCRARVWSRASTVQLVPDGSVAVQYLNSKQYVTN